VKSHDEINAKKWAKFSLEGQRLDLTFRSDDARGYGTWSVP